VGRISLDGRLFESGAQGEGPYRQTADIVVAGERRGVVEVVYSEKKPLLAEGPFLKEERNLLDAFAREIALIIERREAAEERSRLEGQLQHADRLATIGQLSAGVAHELNEPLSAVLGFAQLALKDEALPTEAASDIKKIEAAALHAREIVKKLMLFARQTPPRKKRIDVNRAVEGSLYFFEARCAKSQIEVVRKISPDLPEVLADLSQLQQVLVNLIVNAIQAMPEGGRLTIATETRGQAAVLRIADTGSGMSSSVREKIFLPFFTTKGIHEGTGLGLAVAHGIVAAHGGSIRVESEEGVGTAFEVEMPGGVDGEDRAGG
jgi:signal transduction histidine kinase